MTFGENSQKCPFCRYERKFFAAGCCYTTVLNTEVEIILLILLF